jgi:hypothetical protein
MSPFADGADLGDDDDDDDDDDAEEIDAKAAAVALLRELQSSALHADALRGAVAGLSRREMEAITRVMAS